MLWTDVKYETTNHANKKKIGGHSKLSVLDNIIQQRVNALQKHINDPNTLKEKLDELSYFVTKKQLGAAH